MAFIVEQYVGDRGIQLGVEDVIRPFSFGTNWQKIRVGIRLAANGYDTLPIGSFGPRLGICTGYGGTYGNATDCVFSTFWNSVQAGNIGGTAPNRYYTSSTATFSNVLSQRVGSTTTTFGTRVNTTPSFSANPTALRSYWFMDVTKGTVGVAALSAVSTWTMTSTQVLSDRTRGDFLAAMEAETSPSSLTENVYSSITLPTRFVKDWDSMVVGWSRSTPTLCVYDMTVVRFI
jgi:hypothetical protein